MRTSTRTHSLDHQTIAIQSDRRTLSSVSFKIHHARTTALALVSILELFCMQTITHRVCARVFSSTVETHVSRFEHVFV